MVGVELDERKDALCKLMEGFDVEMVKFARMEILVKRTLSVH